ncbi:MAG: hypothetical protein QHH09_02585 [Microgenomates group bacterium]|nr:hypothetical protein [Microgenomates group bacterium]
MKKKFQKGEIATVVTMTVLLIASAFSFVASNFFKKPQTTTTKAVDTGSCRDNPETPLTGFIWKAYCDRPCNPANGNNDCIDLKVTGVGEINPETSYWCYGFSSGPRCLQLQRDPNVPIDPVQLEQATANFGCYDGGRPRAYPLPGFCEYGVTRCGESNPYAIDNPYYLCTGTKNDCVIVHYSGSFPYGPCRYANPDVCRRRDGQGGCAGVCNWKVCIDNGAETISAEAYEGIMAHAGSYFPLSTPGSTGGGTSGGGTSGGGGGVSSGGGGDNPANPPPGGVILTDLITPPSNPTLVSLPSECIASSECLNFKNSLSLSDQNNQYVCQKCDQTDKFKLVKLPSAPAETTLPTLTMLPEGPSPTSAGKKCYIENQTLSDGDLICSSTNSRTIIACVNGQTQTLHCLTNKVCQNGQCVDAAAVIPSTAPATKTCSPRIDQNIKNIIYDKWDQQYPCGDGYLAGQNDTLYVYRYCPDRECKYNCIQKSNGQRVDCWFGQAAPHHTWVRILNSTTDTITITKLFVQREGWFMSARKYIEDQVPIILQPKETYMIDFTGTEIACSSSINLTGVIRVSLTYDTPTRKDSYIRRDFGCWPDFSGLLIVE